MSDNEFEQTEDLLEIISTIDDPKEIAEIAIQIFCAVAKLSTEVGLLNPMLIQGFIPMKALSEKLENQELTDIVITAEMETMSLLEPTKENSKRLHPANVQKRFRKWGKDN